MGDLTPEDLERIRRSLAMSPSLPGPAAEDLLAEVHRLRRRLVEVVGELDRAAEAIDQARSRARHPSGNR